MNATKSPQSTCQSRTAPGHQRSAVFGFPSAAARARRSLHAPLRSTGEGGGASIAVTFVVDPKEGAEVEVPCPSGEQLRAVMLENKVRA